MSDREATSGVSTRGGGVEPPVAAQGPAARRRRSRLPGRAWRRKVDEVYELTLAEAVQADIVASLLDEVADLERAVEGEPWSSTSSRGVTRVHPLRVELRARREALARALAALKLPENYEGDDEPAAPQEPMTPSEIGRRAAQARWHRGGA